jgi:methyl-accepting chemotaxis protein
MFAFRGRRASVAEELRDQSATVAAINRSQAVIEFKLDGTILTANRNFLDAMGYSLEEIQGRHHSLFVDPQESGSPEYRDFWRLLNNGEFVARKFRRLGKGGREIWIQASYNPVLDDQGKPFKVIKFATDITEVEHERARNEAERNAAAVEQRSVITALGESLGKLSAGDLTAEIREDFRGAYAQLKSDFNQAVDSVRAAMSAISTSTESLRDGSEEIASAADNLSRRTEQQAASLEETAAALDEITATVKRSAEGARLAAAAASSAKSDAERSGDVVREAVSAMGEIESSSKQITQIIGVIDEIAFQTNLLALNAGVEAARAGDAGKGFAVVAQEVRALAQRSAEAAKEIKTLISNSTTHVERGVKLVAETGRALTGIVDKVTEVDGSLSDIANSTQEQATGLNQVNDAVNEMDQVTQQNAAMVEQTNAAATNLKGEAFALAEQVSRFRLGENGAPPNRLEVAQARRQAPAENPVATVQARARRAFGGAAPAEVWSEF